MDLIEVEGKTYEEAIKKACAALNAEEKDLDIDVKEVDTKGILGLLGSRKIRIVAKLKGKVMEERPLEESVQVALAQEQETGEEAAEVTPQAYGEKFLREVGS